MASIAIALVGGCVRLAPPPDTGLLVRCPDPANCTISNGTGVYFAEHGAAGIGPTQLMITHFINRGSSVGLHGRYFDTGTSRWRLMTDGGLVYGADFRDQRGLTVVSVTEDATVPTWTVAAANQPPFPVTGPALRDLTLYLMFSAPGPGVVHYTLGFAPDDRVDPTRRQAAKYQLRWRALASTADPVIYCSDAAGAPDPVVFQAGIDVDPVIGTVTAVPKYVTLSCNRGAPATAYRWGYDHNSPDLYYFASAIHMKRAAYCGDARFFTVDGTRIRIDDDHTHDPEFRPDQLEAWWSPTGALCANPDRARHGDVVRNSGFAWRCGGAQLPVCQVPPGSPPATKYLVDAAVTPIP
jgi:hypothetical protein